MGRYRKHEWNGRYQRILLLYEQGKSLKEIAETVGMYPTSISKIIKKDKFIARRLEFEDKIIDKVRTSFEEKALSAAKKICDLAHSGKPEQRIQLEAAKEVLYQIGCKPPEVIETRRREYTPEELQSSLRVAREMEQIAEKLSEDKSPYVIENNDTHATPVTDAGTS